MRNITSSTHITHITHITHNIITLHMLNINNVTTSPGEPDHLLAWLIVPDDSLQVARQGVHDGLHVTFQSFNNNVSQG